MYNIIYEVGKGGATTIKTKIFISFLITLAGITIAPFFTYASNTFPSLGFPDLFNKVLPEISNNVNTSLPNLPELKLPLDFRKSKGFLSGTSTGSGLDLSLFFNTKRSISGLDFVTAIKAVLVLAINLFLIVIQTVVAILKALLPFLQ